jgi:hypothetical protein
VGYKKTVGQVFMPSYSNELKKIYSIKAGTPDAPFI